MKILIDENLPRYLKAALADYEPQTVQEMGWRGTDNGDLLRLAEPSFDVFLTGDKNIKYQQDLNKYRVAVVVFPSNKLSVVKRLESRVKRVLARIAKGDLIELETEE